MWMLNHRQRQPEVPQQGGEVNNEQQEEEEPTETTSNMEPITVLLNLEKKAYEVGNYIKGSICLYVPQTAAGCDEYSGIHLLLIGEESIKLSISKPTGVQTCDGSPLTSQQCFSTPIHETVVKQDTEVIKLNTPLTPGQYEYPFCWKSTQQLPCSMRFKSPDKSTCEVRYRLIAYMCPTATNLQMNNKSLYEVVNCSQPIRMKASSLDTTSLVHDSIATSTATATTPTDSEEDVEQSPNENENHVCKSYTMKSWLFKKGSVELGFDIGTDSSHKNSTTVSPNSKISFDVIGKNLSSLSVDHLLVQWIETIQWGVSGLEQRTSQRILAETTLPVSHLPMWQPTTKKQPASSEEKTVSSSDRIPVQLQIKNARESYEGHMMKVEHSIQVVVVTKGKCTTRPKSIMSMEVHRNAHHLGSHGPTQQHYLCRSCSSHTHGTSSVPPVMVEAQPLINNNQRINDCELPQAVAITEEDQLNSLTEEEEEELYQRVHHFKIIHDEASSFHLMLQEPILEPIILDVI